MTDENKQLNPEIIELVELGNDWNKAFPNSGTVLARVGENTTKDQIRERLKEALEKHRALIKSFKEETKR